MSDWLPADIRNEVWRHAKRILRKEAIRQRISEHLANMARPFVPLLIVSVYVHLPDLALLLAKCSFSGNLSMHSHIAYKSKFGLKSNPPVDDHVIHTVWWMAVWYDVTY